jgi:mono/diheme cytochrome c family protein
MPQAKLLSAVVVASLLASCGKKPAPPIPEGATVDGTDQVIDLGQGWSHADQDALSFASFGSKLLPKAWLQHLEVATGSERFAADANMARLGFILSGPTKANPAGFPVGFTVAVDKKGREWAGLGCAACHTGQLDYKGTQMRIDGGQGLIDFDEFEGDLVESLSATATQDDKFGRFADALKVQAADRPALRNELVAAAQKLDARHRLNDSPVRYGPGRLDAFGQIFNAVAVEFLGIPGNRHVPDAPVSFPVLWDASHLDLVQWNGSAPNAGPGPLLQNVTTAMAVYGSLDIAGHDGKAGYPSSVDFKQLGQIQNWFYKLKSPQWPESVLGKLDAARLARGASVYSAQCQSCHALSDRNNPKRELKAVLTPLDVIGTDPKMVRNFLDAKSATGPWQGQKVAILAGDKFGAQAQTIDLVAHAAIGATLRHPLAAVHDAAVSWHTVYKAGIAKHPDYYKARPLSGIWASAPYLHNGSVSSLADLLKPPRDRLSMFHVGSREFDPAAVGLSTTEGPDTVLFDTALPGNSNAGHVFGTELPEGDKLALLEYLKSL